MNKFMTYTEENNNRLININFENINATVNVSDFEEHKNIRLSEEKTQTRKSIIEILEINNQRYYLYTSKSGILYITTNINKYCKVKQNLSCKITKKYIYFFGSFTNINHKIKNFNKIYLNGKKIGTIKRISNTKFLKNFMIMRIKISKILESGEIHNNIRIGKSRYISVPLLMGKEHCGTNYFAKKKIGDNLILIRNVINGKKVRITSIKFEPEYKKINLLKNFVASKLYKIMPKRKINLLFEKETNKAEESRILYFRKNYGDEKKEKFKIQKLFCYK